MTAGNTTQGTFGQGYYRKRIWSGGDGARSEEHPYAYQLRESLYNPCTYWYWFWPSNPMSGSQMAFAPGLPRSAVDRTANLLNKATGKVWEDLVQTRFNLGVFSGEFRESYRMLSGMVHALARAIRYAKRGQFDRALRVLAGARRNGDTIDELLNVAASNWMVWHFGILPLLADIKSVYELMTKSYNPIFKGRWPAVTIEKSEISYNGVVWQHQLKAVAEVRGVVSVKELSLWDRVGLTDPYSIAWELTRFSWLVDWILPIGNFLTAINAANRTEGSSFWLTRHQMERLDSPVNTESLVIIVPSMDDCFDEFHQPGAANSRAFMTALPWHFPTVSNPLGDNLSRWLTASALLKQVTR